MPPLPKLSPMDLLQVSAPFDDADFLYEVKFDGFRALAYVQNGHCELVSRKGHVYRRFADLCQSMANDLKARAARATYPTVRVLEVSRGRSAQAGSYQTSPRRQSQTISPLRSRRGDRGVRRIMMPSSSAGVRSRPPALSTNVGPRQRSQPRLS